MRLVHRQSHAGTQRKMRRASHGQHQAGVPMNGDQRVRGLQKGSLTVEAKGRHSLSSDGCVHKVPVHRPFALDIPTPRNAQSKIFRIRPNPCNKTVPTTRNIAHGVAKPTNAPWSNNGPAVSLSPRAGAVLFRLIQRYWKRCQRRRSARPAFVPGVQP